MGDARELLEGFGRAIEGKAGELERVSSSDIDFRDSMQQSRGIDALRPYLQAWSTAFPDGRMVFDNVLESSGEAAGEVTYRGTHTGPLAGPQGEIPATGKSVELRGSVWVRVRDGKVTSFRGYYDTASMMAQLGVIPTPATMS